MKTLKFAKQVPRTELKAALPGNHVATFNLWERGWQCGIPISVGGVAKFFLWGCGDTEEKALQSAINKGVNDHTQALEIIWALKKEMYDE